MSGSPVEQLIEYVTSTAALRVDREKGIIHNVKVLGRESANGRSYSPKAIREARGLYEGRQVNVNHTAKPGDQRSAYDRFGWLEGVYDKDDELYAREFHYLKSHPLAAALTEAAERNPKLFGLSHNANGKTTRDKSGKLVVESIVSVTSVDLVADPATVAGLYESRGHAAMTTTLSQLLETLKGKPEAAALKEMADAAGLPAATEMPSAEKPEDAIKSGFKAAINAVIDGDGDMKVKLAKIKDILKAQEKLMGGGDKPDDKKPDGDKKDGDAKESKIPDASADKALLEQLTRKDKARDVCDELGIKPTAILLESMVAIGDVVKMKALAEGFKPAAGGGGRPKSVAPGVGGGNTGPKDIKEAAKDWKN